MIQTNVQKWFQELKRLWVEKDIDALQKILADDFEYYENPFERPIANWKELQNAWQGVNDQDIQNLEIIITIDGEKVGSARYELSFIDPSGVLHDSSGAYYLKLNDEGKAIEFRQWWTENE